MTATVHKLKSAGRAVVYGGPLPRESASEIAARLRAGKPPLRHLVYRESIDG